MPRVQPEELTPPKPMTQNYMDESYVIEEELPSGFWHRLDRRIENAADKFSNTKTGKALSKAGRGAKILWNSRAMTPVRWPTKKLAKGIDSLMKHPGTQLTTFATGLTVAIIAVTAATPAGLPLAATTVALIAGGKLVNTLYQARKSHRVSKLQEQLKLLTILHAMKSQQNKTLETLPDEVQKKIKENLTQKTTDQSIHRKKIMAKSEMFVKDFASSLLTLAGGICDASQLCVSVTSALKTTDTVITAFDIKDIVLSGPEQLGSLTETRSENDLRKLINSMSKSLDVPHAKKIPTFKNLSQML